jgi:predicted AlkP superfamily phosphohydrolase/phosphomutase
MSRAVILGLDAASPDLVRRWANDLPNMRRLLAQGTWGVLRSTVPAYTFPAWPCMATGKNPARVGVFGLHHRQEDAYRLFTPNSSHWRTPAIWDLVSSAGRKVIVFNVPGTYPPTQVNGVMVSGKPAPTDAGVAITHPSDLLMRLHEVTGGYLQGPSADFDDASRGAELETWEQVLASQQDALEYLMDTEPWDLVFAVSMAIDAVCHRFWKHLDPDHPQHDPHEAKRFSNAIRDIYMLEDSRVGRILERLEPDDLLVIVSDHGSAPCYHQVSLTKWLVDTGYLVLKSKPNLGARSLLSPIVQPIVSSYRSHAWLRRMVRPLRRTALRDAVVEAHFTRTRGRTPWAALPFDWDRTIAYNLSDARICLNVAGREPKGVVQPGADYFSRREDLRGALQDAVNPDTGERLFSAVHLREELYAGPYLEQAPDLIVVSSDTRGAIGGAMGEKLVDQPIVSGAHHPEGLLMAYGSGVQAGQSLEAGIMDVTPTVLHFLGLAVPEECDGTVELGWFMPDSPVVSSPVRIEKVPDAEKEAYEWTPDEAAQVEAHLRGLGYLD